MRRDFKLETPQYFNFAKDVLDQWTDVEKVWGKGLSACSVPRWAMSGDSLFP